jgi:hypothetical protein
VIYGNDFGCSLPLGWHFRANQIETHERRRKIAKLRLREIKKIFKIKIVSLKAIIGRKSIFGKRFSGKNLISRILLLPLIAIALVLPFTIRVANCLKFHCCERDHEMGLELGSKNNSFPTPAPAFPRCEESETFLREFDENSGELFPAK